MPYDEVVESSEPVLTPTQAPLVFGADIIQWPWPRLIATNYRTMLFSKDSVGLLQLFELTLNDFGNWEGIWIGPLGPADDITTIDVADFGPFYVICTHGISNRTWVKDPALNALTELESPLIATGCNYGGQFLGGNISEWQELGSNGLLWSGIGSFEFDPSLDVTAGWRSLVNSIGASEVPIIRRILPLHESVVVYTDCGNVALVDSTEGVTFTYGLIPLKGLGIASGNHVAGNPYVHGLIDLNKEFWLLENTSFRTLNQTGGKFTNRGYRKQIEELMGSGTEVIVSYAPWKNTFYISNGISSLVVNDFGAYITHQAVSGVVLGWNKNLYGTFRDFGDREARIVVEGMDFGAQGLKTLESLVVGFGATESTTTEASVQVRYRMKDSFRQTKWKPINSRGEAFIGNTAIEHRAWLKFSEYEGTSLYSLKANVKFGDSRFRRGVGANAKGEE